MRRIVSLSCVGGASTAPRPSGRFEAFRWGDKIFRHRQLLSGRSARHRPLTSLAVAAAARPSSPTGSDRAGGAGVKKPSQNGASGGAETQDGAVVGSDAARTLSSVRTAIAPCFELHYVPLPFVILGATQSWKCCCLQFKRGRRRFLLQHPLCCHSMPLMVFTP